MLRSFRGIPKARAISVRLLVLCCYSSLWMSHTTWEPEHPKKIGQLSVSFCQLELAVGFTSSSAREAQVSFSRAVCFDFFRVPTGKFLSVCFGSVVMIIWGFRGPPDRRHWLCFRKDVQCFYDDENISDGLFGEKWCHCLCICSYRLFEDVKSDSRCLDGTENWKLICLALNT